LSSYEVVSDRLVGHAQGSDVTELELADCNIPALIEAGHIRPTETAQPEQDPSTKADDPAANSEE
jgi:hypothetical protein